jgi:hypothetical protein
MRTRGKILREPSDGPGLLMIEGQQFRFSLEGAWKGEVAPKRGLVVEVELDRDLQVISVKAVPEAQLAKEENERAQAVMPRSATKHEGFVHRLIAKVPTLGLVACWRRRQETKQENPHETP